MKLKEKVWNPLHMIYTLVIPSFIGLTLGLTLLIIGLTYDKMEPGVDIFILVISGISFFIFFIYSIICPTLISVYPKHKKLTYIFLQEYMFKDEGEN